MVVSLFHQRKGNSTETRDHVVRDGYMTPGRLSEGLWWPASQTGAYLSPHLVVKKFIESLDFVFIKLPLPVFN